MSRFLAAYQTLFSKSTDAPREFGHAGALNCLSGIALGRRWIDRGGGIRPNLYMMLVAGSSSDRKSTSVRLSMNLLEAVAPERVGPDDFTAEGLLKYMRPRKGKGKTRNKLVLGIEEFGQTLAAKGSYAETLGATLCKLYDGSDFTRVRATSQMLTISKPRIGVFAAVAYGMLEQFADPREWATGFYSRFLFVTPLFWGPKYTTVPPTAKHEFDAARLALASLQDELKQAPGPMAVLPSAEQLHAQYAASFPNFDDNPIWAAQRERTLYSVWKLAMLYQIDDDPHAPISPYAMDSAITFARRSWRGFKKIHAATASDEFSRLANKISDRIRESGTEGFAKREILRSFNLTVGKLVPILDTLVKMGAVEIVNVVPTGGGRPREVCRWR